MPGDDVHITTSLQRIAAAIVPGGGRIERVQRLSGGASQQTWAFDVRADAGCTPLILRRAADGASERARMTVGLGVEARLIAAAKAAVQAFTAEREPEEATSLKAPPGGWDHVPAQAVKPRRPAAATSPSATATSGR